MGCNESSDCMKLVGLMDTFKLAECNSRPLYTT